MHTNKNVPIDAIKELQEYVSSKIKDRGFDDETIHERLLLLVEEVGELVNATRKNRGSYVDEKRNITNQVGEELADVLNMLFAVADELKVDIANEFQKKEVRIDQRSYKRSKK